MSNMTAQMKHINGLKGLACIMVMLGHFIGLYRYAENFPATSKFLQIFDAFLGSKIGFVIDENFWVILFFLVSGYLVSLSKIPDIRSFLYKSFSRFLRLGLPILFACAIIFVIQKTFGFYTAETSDLFECSFIQNHYLSNFSLWQVIKSPAEVLLIGKNSFCSPYWVLREMFITSVLIYFFSFLKNKINSNVFVSLWGIALFASMFLSNVVFAGLLGMTICFVQNSKDYLANKVFLFFTLAFCLSLFVIPRARIAPVFFGALILIVPKLNLINRIFSSGIAQFTNKISFGIYSFHWPVFCSFGMFFIIKTHERLGLINSVILSMAVSLIITSVISLLYYFLIEKHIYKVLKLTDNRWQKMYN